MFLLLFSQSNFRENDSRYNFREYLLLHYLIWCRGLCTVNDLLHIFLTPPPHPSFLVSNFRSQFRAISGKVRQVMIERKCVFSLYDDFYVVQNSEVAWLSRIYLAHNLRSNQHSTCLETSTCLHHRPLNVLHAVFKCQNDVKIIKRKWKWYRP